MVAVIGGIQDGWLAVLRAYGITFGVIGTVGALFTGLVLLSLHEKGDLVGHDHAFCTRIGTARPSIFTT